MAHLSSLHPSRYSALVDGVSLVGLTDVHPVADEAAALRLVVFVDRLYDRQIPVVASGDPLDQVFTAVHAGRRLPQEVPALAVPAGRLADPPNLERLERHSAQNAIHRIWWPRSAGPDRGDGMAQTTRTIAPDSAGRWMPSGPIRKPRSVAVTTSTAGRSSGTVCAAPDRLATTRSAPRCTMSHRAVSS